MIDPTKPPKRLRPTDYEYLRKQGYSDDDLRADGFEPPKPVGQRTWGDEAAGAGLSALKGATFGLADDVVGLVSPGAADYMNQEEAEFRAANPAISVGTELAGGLLTGGLAAKGIKAAAGALPGVLQRAAPALQSLRGQSAITGGTAAAGASEGDLGDRATAFGFGAAGGAVLGPVVAKGVEKGLQAGTALARRAADSPLGTAAQTVARQFGQQGETFADRMQAIADARKARLTPEGRANAYVAKMMGRDQLTPQQVQAELAGAAPDDPRYLMNVGGKNTQLGTKVTQAIPSKATDEVPRRLLEQNQGALDRVEQRLETAVGRELKDFQTRYQELADEATAAGDPYYAPIRGTVLDVHRPLREITDKAQRAASRTIRDVLRRPAGREAYNTALRNVRNMGKDHPTVAAWKVQLDPQTGANVPVPDTPRRAVTLGMLDDMKRVLDEQILDIEAAIASGTIRGPQLSTMKSQLPGLRKTRNDLVGAADVLTGGSDGVYATARREVAPFLQRRDAFSEGYSSPFGSEGNVLNSAGRQAAPDAYAEGYATRLVDKMRGARESQAGWRDVTSMLFDSDAARAKLGAAIPDPNVGPSLQLERQLREQANNALVPRGSQTMPLAAGVMDATGGEVAGAVAGAMQAAQQPVRTGVRLGAQALWDRFGGGLNEAAAGEAGSLFTTRLQPSDPRLMSLLDYWTQREAERRAAQAVGARLAPAATTPATRRLRGGSR